MLLSIRLFRENRPREGRSFLMDVRGITFTRVRCNQWRTQELCSGGGGSTNSVEDRGQREQGSAGGSRLVRSSGGSCNLIQEISFHIVRFS